MPDTVSSFIDLLQLNPDAVVTVKSRSAGLLVLSRSEIVLQNDSQQSADTICFVDGCCSAGYWA